MQTGKMTLWTLAAVLIVLAFVLRAVVPRNWYVPGPLSESHYYRPDWAAFRVLLAAGIIIALVAVLKVIVARLSGR